MTRQELSSMLAGYISTNKLHNKKNPMELVELSESILDFLTDIGVLSQRFSSENEIIELKKIKNPKARTNPRGRL